MPQTGYSRLLHLLVLTALLVSLYFSIEAAEQPAGPESADLFKGKSVDLYFYQNRFFSFDMTIPGDWYPLSSKEFLEVLRRESKGDDYSEQKLEKDGLTLLLSISRYRPAQRGPRGEFNPNIVMAATDLSKFSGIKTSKDYAEWMKSMVKTMGLQPATDLYPMQLGGTEFWRFDGVDRGQELTYTAHMSTLRKGYALTIQLNAGSRADMTRLDRILKSLHFE